jgi:hypothetical protein
MSELYENCSRLKKLELKIKESTIKSDGKKEKK